MDDPAWYIGKQKHRYNIVYNFRKRGEPHHTNQINDQSPLNYTERRFLSREKPAYLNFPRLAGITAL
jgi:hypothetical protein